LLNLELDQLSGHFEGRTAGGEIAINWSLMSCGFSYLVRAALSGPAFDQAFNLYDRLKCYGYVI
jgi:hypothetical protein